MASEYRWGFSSELEFSLINYLSKMLCDSIRRLSNTQITARCQIIYFPLVFPAPEVLKHNSQNDLPTPSSISCPKPEVTTTSRRVQGSTLRSHTAWILPLSALICRLRCHPFPFSLASLAFLELERLVLVLPQRPCTHWLFSSLGQPFLSYFTSRPLLS